MLRCPYCRAEIRGDEKSCKSCGRRLPRISPEELMKLAKLKRYRARGLANVIIGFGGCMLFLLYFKIANFAAVLALFGLISAGISLHAHRRFKKAEAEILSRGVSKQTG